MRLCEERKRTNDSGDYSGIFGLFSVLIDALKPGSVPQRLEKHRLILLNRMKNTRSDMEERAKRGGIGIADAILQEFTELIGEKDSGGRSPSRSRSRSAERKRSRVSSVDRATDHFTDTSAMGMMDVPFDTNLMGLSDVPMMASHDFPMPDQDNGYQAEIMPDHIGQDLISVDALLALPAHQVKLQ